VTEESFFKKYIPYNQKYGISNA